MHLEVIYTARWNVSQTRELALFPRVCKIVTMEMQILGTNLELWEGSGSVLLVNFSFISSWHMLLERTSHMFSDCMDQ